MSTILRLSPEEYDRMIANGAFVGIRRRIELIHGELREMTPAGPVHEDIIDYLTRWSTEATTALDCVVRVQSSVDMGDSRPEPDLTWLKPGRYAARRPQSTDVLLLIEVADSSLEGDLAEKAVLYAQSRIVEYWVVDVQRRCIHLFMDSDGNRFSRTRVVRSNEQLAPQVKPSANIDLQDLFAVC